MAAPYNAYYTMTGYVDFANAIHETDCRQLALYIGGDDPEYVLHTLLPDVTFQHWGHRALYS